MKTISGHYVPVKDISVSKDAQILTKFVSANNGTYDVINAYLHRASASFNELNHLHKELGSCDSHNKHKTHRTKNGNDSGKFKRQESGSGNADGENFSQQEEEENVDGGEMHKKKKKKKQEVESLHDIHSTVKFGVREADGKHVSSRNPTIKKCSSMLDNLVGSLDLHNVNSSAKGKTCIGVARGLDYLHTGVKQVIIHRDVKSANILLDEKWEAKVSDFGLARIGGPMGISMMTTSVNTKVKGSIGYLDPEYYKRNILTEKSDVYSFGVMLLEVLSGRHPLLHWEEKQGMSLANWAKHCYEKGTLSEIVDSELKDQIKPQCLNKFSEVALSYLLEDGTQRPSMKDIVGVLEFVL
ncbi:hypothetical protein JHK86_016384 [Glycine max]|nr:hypothetical protein JHK86_016384 [Glycine max]